MKVKLVYYESGDWEELYIDGRRIAGSHFIEADWLLTTLFNHLGLPKEDLEIVYNHSPVSTEDQYK